MKYHLALFNIHLIFLIWAWVVYLIDTKHTKRHGYFATSLINKYKVKDTLNKLAAPMTTYICILNNTIFVWEKVNLYIFIKVESLWLFEQSDTTDKHTSARHNPLWCCFVLNINLVLLRIITSPKIDFHISSRSHSFEYTGSARPHTDLFSEWHISCRSTIPQSYSTLNHRSPMPSRRLAPDHHLHGRKRANMLKLLRLFCIHMALE